MIIHRFNNVPLQKDRHFDYLVQLKVALNHRSPGFIDQDKTNTFNVNYFFLNEKKKKTERLHFSSVSDDRGCQDLICELHLGNYTRHDPSIIECIADNGKSSRISKVFHIDVFCKSNQRTNEQTNGLDRVLDPPQLITYVRTLTGVRTIDIFLECSTLGNPLPVITWLDDNQEEISTNHHYSIDKTNHSSILSFTIYPGSQSKVLYYCRSNNSLGTVEKLINISGRN